MKTKHVLCMIMLLLLLIPMQGQTESPAAVQEKEGVWKGNVSSQKDVFIKVVETQKEWGDLWKRAFDRPAPDIDFEKKVVACVFLGHKADWLYSIHIGDPVRRDNAWIVPYGMADIILELSGPFKAGGQYAMKVLEKKTDAPMILKRGMPSDR